MEDLKFGHDQERRRLIAEAGVPDAVLEGVAPPRPEGGSYFDTPQKESAAKLIMRDYLTGQLDEESARYLLEGIVHQPMGRDTGMFEQFVRHFADEFGLGPDRSQPPVTLPRAVPRAAPLDTPTNRRQRTRRTGAPADFY